MKIAVAGTRGIPDIQGGVETHCEELYPRLAALGHDITVFRRTPYTSASPGLREFRGVKLKDIYAPRRKSIEAIVHTTLAVIEAHRMGADILHVHAVGPALMIPFARLLGLKVVMTNHGPDYDRSKWGRLAKFVLRTGERFGSLAANRIIVISEVIRSIVRNRYGRPSELIFNGVNPPVPAASDDYVRSLGLEPGRYIFTLGRFVSEKGFHDLIDAWTRSANPRGLRLAIAGDADHEDDYSRALKRKAREAGVVLPGFVKGDRLNQLFTHAALFVLPSYHEGLPIALLEALSYGLPAIVSDIPANRIPALPRECFFPAGDTDALASLLDSAPAGRRAYDLSPYDWDHIAAQTDALYRSL